jgi:hypothetical protein
MKNTLKVLVLVCAAALTASAQNRHLSPVFDHPLAPFSAAAHVRGLNSTPAGPDTLINVLAVMVDFQTDDDDRTSGTGKFDLSDPKHLIDAPPRNKAFFEDHCTFLRNYFRKASGGMLTIRTTVLDSVYHLPHLMQYYSSPRTSKTNAELGRLAWDAWRMVDSISTAASNPVDFGSYQAFAIFHAGAGRDIDLVSLYGYDPTPYDIPSIYLNLQGLRTALGDSGLAGIPVRNGAFNITNSMILPETENRELATLVGTTVVQFSTNGLFVANIGSYLGLPDLFDTKTGKTGIGRFGLMDGQSIFSWAGVFPPEPSAWEKYALGWVNPVTVTAADSIYPVPAVSLTPTDTIYRVPISQEEYFLVENRNRDANRDGATVTMSRNGVPISRHWNKDTTGFNSFDQDSLWGVITDIDETDWSLPGFVDSKTSEFYDGGILIWHVDEGVISAKLATDAVNADPTRRGVNLMEADGSPDIGQTYGITSAGSGSEDGTPLDYWYRGNIAPMRKDFEVNGLTPTTHPSSQSNDGASSHIIIGCVTKTDTAGISYRGPHMSIRIRLGDDQVKPMPGFPKFLSAGAGANSVAANDSLDALVVVTSRNHAVRTSATSSSVIIPVSAIYGFKTDGTLLLPGGSSDGRILDNTFPVGYFEGKPALGALFTSSAYGVVSGAQILRDFFPPEEGPEYNYIGGWLGQDLNHDNRLDPAFTPMQTMRRITTSPVVSDSFVAVGAVHGIVYLMSRDGSRLDSVRIGSSDTASIVSLSLFGNPGVFIAVSSDGTMGLTGLTCAGGTVLSASNAAFAVGSVISANAGKQVVVVSRDGTVSMGSPCGGTGFSVQTGGIVSNMPAIADIDGDGQKDIVVFSGSKIYVINAAGSVVAHFPVSVPTSENLLSSPVIADVDGDGMADIVVVTQEGLVAAYGRDGKMVRGFPLLSGPNSGSTPAVFSTSALSADPGVKTIGLAVASDDGYLYAWKTGSSSAPVRPWPQYLHDSFNTGLDETVPTLNISSEFLPSSRVYNWPNPVKATDGFLTHIRYYTSSDASVTIKIFDMAGDLVTDFGGRTFRAQGGLDQEVEWNVSGIQSGLYFAHVDAKGATSSGTSIIKVVVIK